MNKHISPNRAGAPNLQRVKVALIALFFVPGLLWAQANGYGDTEDKMCGFLGNITKLLNIGSIAVVTIAIIFAGYQIAFAHKRISDVAPILIGGLLIGAAGQIAKMIIGSQGGECAATAMVLLNSLPTFYA